MSEDEDDKPVFEAGDIVTLIIAVGIFAPFIIVLWKWALS